MWADNETRIDLLGFDYLVDSLEVVLTEPRLLPVTVGVLGDWRSGKTSLLHMVADRLGDDYVVVRFSPWRYEAYEDVKAALMEAVLTKLALEQIGLSSRRNQEAATDALGAGQPAIKRGKGRIQRLGQGDVPGVVAADAASQLPNPFGNGLVVEQVDSKAEKV